jgi:hypothetical protein
MSQVKNFFNFFYSQRSFFKAKNKQKIKIGSMHHLLTFFLVVFKTCSFLKLLGIAFYSLLAYLTRNIKIAGHFFGLRDAGHLMKMRDCPAENGTGGNPTSPLAMRSNEQLGWSSGSSSEGCMKYRCIDPRK